MVVPISHCSHLLELIILGLSFRRFFSSGVLHLASMLRFHGDIWTKQILSVCQFWPSGNEMAPGMKLSMISRYLVV